MEDLKTEFFKQFGEQSFRGYPLEQCHSIWDFFEPHLKEIKVVEPEKDCKDGRHSGDTGTCSACGRTYIHLPR